MARPARALLFAFILLLAGPLAGCLTQAAVNREVDSARALEDAALARAARAEARVAQLEEAGEAQRHEADILRGDLARANESRAAQDARLDDLAARLAHAEARVANDSLQRATGELQAARDRLDEVELRYAAALEGTFPALTTVEAGNLVWHFETLRAEHVRWEARMDDYREYALRPRHTDFLEMQTTSGPRLRVASPLPYVTPSFFEGRIGALTENRTDREFVMEAFNLKRQLITYNFTLVDESGAYKFPAETMGEASGICGDTSILLASLLLAGNAHADYGLDVKLWIVNLDPTTGELDRDPQRVNHALLEVDYADGSRQFLETTSRAFLAYEDVWGWPFPIPAEAEAAGAGA